MCFAFKRSTRRRATQHGSRQFLALERLLSDTTYQNYYQATSVRPGSMAPADIHNLVILSRWPIREQRQLHHDIVAKWSSTPLLKDHHRPHRLKSSGIVLSFMRKSLCLAAPFLHFINLHFPRLALACPISERSKSAVALRAAPGPRVNSSQLKGGKGRPSKLVCSPRVSLIANRMRSSRYVAISIRKSMTCLSDF